MFYLFELILLYDVFYLSYCIKAVPPEAKGRHTLMWLWLGGFTLWGLSIVLMFTLWNLTYLAVATGTMYVVYTILSVIFIWKPAMEHFRKARQE